MLNQRFSQGSKPAFINKLNANDTKKIGKGRKKLSKNTQKLSAGKTQRQLYVFTDPQVFLILKPNRAESKLKGS